jgi:outer membrane protein assembly factor BamB
VVRPAACSVLALEFLLATTVFGCRRERDYPTALDEFSTYGSVHTRWLQPQVKAGNAPPKVIGDVVVFSTGDRRLIARELQTGKSRWSTLLTSSVGTEQIWGQNVAASSGVVVACLVTSVVGVDVASGRELWAYAPPIDSFYPATPLQPGTTATAYLEADDSSVYVPAWGASVSRLALGTGKPMWVWQSRSTGFRQGAVGLTLSGDTVLVTGTSYLDRVGSRSEFWIQALRRSDGRELWRVSFPASAPGSESRGHPVVWRNLVLISAAGGRVFAIDRFTHEIVWRFAPATSTNDTFAAPALYGDFVYIDGGDQHVYALRAQNGSVLWRTRMGAQFLDLLVTERRVYVTNLAFLGILERSTGRFVARLRQPGQPEFGGDGGFMTPLAARGTQIFATVLDGAWSFEEP